MNFRIERAKIYSNFDNKDVSINDDRDLSLLIPKSCIESTNIRYMNRPSPSFPANNCLYAVLRGKNKLLYISTPDKNKIYKWKKFKPCNSCTLKKYMKQFNIDPSTNSKNISDKLNKIKRILETYGILLHVLRSCWFSPEVSYNSDDDIDYRILKIPFIKKMSKNDKEMCQSMCISDLMYKVPTILITEEDIFFGVGKYGSNIQAMAQVTKNINIPLNNTEKKINKNIKNIVVGLFKKYNLY
jgi:hypothetical protein